MHLLKKETLEINFPIFPIPNIIKDENEFEDELEYEYMTYIQGKSWISLKANDFKYMWDFFISWITMLLDTIFQLLFSFHLKN